MGEIAKYETRPAFGSGRTWKGTILIPAFIFALFAGGVAVLKWRDPSRDLERSHLYGTAYSHAAIRAITGGTSNVSFALTPQEERRLFGRGVPEDWKRKKEEDVIHGTARMLIFGPGGGGIFRITYRYSPSTDSFTVLRIEDSGRTLYEESPSRASQTTTGLRPVVSDLKRSTKHHALLSPTRFLPLFTAGRVCVKPDRI